MLILWRKEGESIWIGETRIKIEKIAGGRRIKFAIDPDGDDVMILRDEVKAKMKRQNVSVSCSVDRCDSGRLA